VGGEIPLWTAKGNQVPTEQNVFLIRDEHGTPRLVGNILTDITGRKRAEAELQKTNCELEEATAGPTHGRPGPSWPAPPRASSWPT